MFDDLILFHRPGGQGSATLQADLAAGGLPGVEPLTGPSRRPGSVFFWQTCLRQIAVFNGETAHETELRLAELLPQDLDQVYRGDEAYTFLLEIICGLHSPMIGETEVYGQFKTALAEFSSPRGSRLNRVFRALLEDAKAVRQAHLEDLGSQSYGSVLRRELKGLRHLEVLGAGQFVQDLLPWIRKDGNEVGLIARNVDKAQVAFPTLAVRAMGQVTEMVPEALLIAAPIAAKDLVDWMMATYGCDACARLRVIVDLRADSSHDGLGARLKSLGLQDVRVLELADVFARLSSNQELLSQRKERALHAILAASRERGAHVEYRPFGWEDVCA